MTATCPLGEDCDTTLAYMAGYSKGKEDAKVPMIDKTEQLIARISLGTASEVHVIAAIRQLQAERDDLTAERATGSAMYSTVARELEAAEAKLRDADAVIRPFSNALDDLDEDWPDTANNFHIFADVTSLTKGDFTRARAYLAGSPAPDVNETLKSEHDRKDVLAPEFLIDLIGELGREVFYLLDDCETSGPVGQETHTITSEGLEKVSAVLDKIEALPFEEPGLILGPGAMLQAALKQTFLAGSPAPDALGDEANRVIRDLTMIVVKLVRYAPEAETDKIFDYLHRKNLASPLRAGSPAPDAVGQAETAGQMLARVGMDGHLWAKEFQTTAVRLGYQPMDEGWLIGWFCNAIMAGYDTAESRARSLAQENRHD